MLMRLGQALLSDMADLTKAVGADMAEELGEAAVLDATSRSHLYVDDAAIASRGEPECTQEAFDVLLLVWLVLGAPISWPKVALHRVTQTTPTRWIGVDYSLADAGSKMRLPPEFVEELLIQLRSVSDRDGRVTDGEAAKLVGRAGRVAFVVPAAAPFAAALRTALADARGTALARRRADQRGSHANARFSVAAAWFEALLRERSITTEAALPLERLIRAGGPPSLVAGHCDSIIFDASPWGGGAVLYEGTRPTAWMTADWTEDLCDRLQVVRGQSAYLAFFEAYTVVASLARWCTPGGRREVAVVGDNIAALTVALSRRGRGDLGRLCRELALRQARQDLCIAVGHLATHLKTIADALSRLSAPEPSRFPEELRGVPQVRWPSPEMLFEIRPLMDGHADRDAGSDA